MQHRAKDSESEKAHESERKRARERESKRERERHSFLGYQGRPRRPVRALYDA